MSVRIFRVLLALTCSVLANTLSVHRDSEHGTEDRAGNDKRPAFRRYAGGKVNRQPLAWEPSPIGRLLVYSFDRLSDARARRCSQECPDGWRTLLEKSKRSRDPPLEQPPAHRLASGWRSIPIDPEPWDDPRLDVIEDSANQFGMVPAPDA